MQIVGLKFDLGVIDNHKHAGSVKVYDLDKLLALESQVRTSFLLISNLILKYFNGLRCCFETVHYVENTLKRYS